MEFGEKVRLARKNKGLKQNDLANHVGVTRQAIINYETKGVRPKKAETYQMLAKVLEVDLDYLMNESDEFIVQATEQYGYYGSKQAEELVNSVGVMFAGGELSSNDKDAVMRAIQEIYWDSKEQNKKYIPKKFLNPDEE